MAALLEISFEGFMKHLFLYAKGYYVRRKGDDGETGSIHIVEDLRELFSKVRRDDVKYVSVNEVYKHVANVFTFCTGLEPNKFKVFMEFLSADVKIESCGVMETISIEFLIRKMLGFIGAVRMQGREDGLVIHLGEPDPSVLPISKKG